LGLQVLTVVLDDDVGAVGCHRVCRGGAVSA
jgi:hypothetical protein